MADRVPMHLWTANRAAKELGVTTDELGRLIRNRVVPAIKIGRRWAIEPTELAGVIDQLHQVRGDLSRARVARERQIAELQDEVRALQAEVDRAELQTDSEVPDYSVSSGPSEPYQRRDGRWSVRVACPDGFERRFVSRKYEPVQPEHQRQKVARSLPVSTRFEVLRRDRYTCRYCGRRPPDVALEIDHVIPVVDGGTDDHANLVAACFECNAGKGRRFAEAPPSGVSG